MPLLFEKTMPLPTVDDICTQTLGAIIFVSEDGIRPRYGPNNHNATSMGFQSQLDGNCKYKP